MSEEELRLLHWVKQYGQDHTTVFVDDVSAVLTQLAAERQARKDAELLARAFTNGDIGRSTRGWWISKQCEENPEMHSYVPVEVTIGPNGLPELTPAIRAAIQAAEGQG